MAKRALFVLFKIALLAWAVQAREQVVIQADGTTHETIPAVVSDSKCMASIQQLTSTAPGLVNDNGISFFIHRNGDSDPCGGTASLSVASVERALQALDLCQESEFSKHQIETFLTTLFHQELPEGACWSADNVTAPQGLYGHCDMGPDRLTLQPDHDQRIPTPHGTWACRFYTREGARISSLEYLSKLLTNAKANAEQCAQAGETCNATTAGPSLHLYAVPAGRMFMLAPSYVGEKFVLEHVTDLDKDGKAIVLETIRYGQTSGRWMDGVVRLQQE